MAVRPIRIYGDPVLRTRTRDITTFDDSLRLLIADMYDTMKAYNGIGLAANQIGFDQRVLVVDVPIDDDTRERFALVNPVLSDPAGAETGEEGCLSIPGIYEDVRRALQVTLRAQDEHGRPIERTVEGYLARAIQHEVDHLDGVLFIDRLSVLKRQFLKRALEALARGELPEGYPPASAAEGAR
jgi:peptide deformylase